MGICLSCLGLSRKPTDVCRILLVFFPVSLFANQVSFQPPCSPNAPISSIRTNLTTPLAMATEAPATDWRFHDMRSIQKTRSGNSKRWRVSRGGLQSTSHYQVTAPNMREHNSLPTFAAPLWTFSPIKHSSTIQIRI